MMIPLNRNICLKDRSLVRYDVKSSVCAHGCLQQEFGIVSEKTPNFFCSSQVTKIGVLSVCPR